MPIHVHVVWKSQHIYDGRVDHKRKYSNKAEKTN